MMKGKMKKITAAAMSAAMAMSMIAVPVSAEEEKKTIKITWWGGQSRHDYTQQLLDLYMESHPDIVFEAAPSGWDGYFEKLSTQTASGSMPDIVQMDYLYITTYAKNGSLADLQPYMDDGTIDVSNIDEKLLSTGSYDGVMVGAVLSSGFNAFGYNPDVLEEAGVEEPTNDWTWSDFIEMATKVKEATGKWGVSADPVLDTNDFHYWVRQHGEKLFSDDNKSLGYEDDAILADFLQMWKDLMDAKVAPNPDEYAQISTLGQEASPIVTGDGAFISERNNYAAKLSSVNDHLKVVLPPLADDSDTKGLWMKPGMFFSISEKSEVKDECAEFINWFINSEEANEIIMAERGVPASSAVRDYMIENCELNTQQKEMFELMTAAEDYCGETPAPDPVGIAEVNEALKNIANSVFYGQASPEEGAAMFREEANAILERNN
ncbi:MAG: sugar ABC transporter substrate-binding protein [Eubacteriales bacterium]|nr:sugar ABC transporter substrate-binding protein [Eubacteriales bacterium]